MKLTSIQKAIRRTIIQSLYESKLAHIGSCLNTVDIIHAIYSIKLSDDVFILSSGHAAAAWYAVLHNFGLIPKPVMEHLGVHPTMDPKLGIAVSTGSLGHGLPIAIGMALGNPNKRVFCVTSDGELTEGSMWESLRFMTEVNLPNLTVIISCNGWGAYGEIDKNLLLKRLRGFCPKVTLVDGHDYSKLSDLLHKSDQKVIFAKTDSDQLPFLHGLDSHYYVMTESDYHKAMDIFQ